jgi:hypothetical protein
MIKLHGKTYRLENLWMTVYSGSGLTMAREFHTDVPVGSWALRNDEGDLVDFDGFRSDLAKRNDIELIHPKG